MLKKYHFLEWQLNWLEWFLMKRVEITLCNVNLTNLLRMALRNETECFLSSVLCCCYVVSSVGVFVITCSIVHAGVMV